MAKEKSVPAAPTKAVATTPKNTAVGAVIDYGADAGAGFENQTKADISIPFLGVLQSNSPQITNMREARPGMLFNTVTEELTDGAKGRVFVPATTKHLYVEWVPREKGGGFVASHPPESPLVQQAIAESKEFGKYVLPNGNQLTETFYVYGTLLDDNDQPSEMAVIAFTSTKISVYKRWNTKVNMFTVKNPQGQKIRPPLFAHKVRITTVKERNVKGEFFNFDLQPANGSVAESLLPPGHPALEQAKDVRNMVDQGLARAAEETQAGAAAPESSNAPTADDWNK